MVPASHVLVFAAVVTVLIAIPGPSVLFTISRALTVGRRSRSSWTPRGRPPRVPPGSGSSGHRAGWR